MADFGQKASEQINDWPMHVSVLNFRADHARIYVTGFAGSILTELGFKEPKNLEGSGEEGSAKAFLEMDCKITPDIAIPAPINKAKTIRGKRKSTKITQF